MLLLRGKAFLRCNIIMYNSSYEEEIIAFSQMISSKSPGNGLSPEEAIIDLSVVIALFKSALHSKKEDGWTKVEKVNLH